MPVVSDNFGPIYQTVVLDGAGNGAVSFQANGSNVRLSNITFAVATAGSQASCVIYKGQVAPGNRVFNSNSGSTGGNAQGNVDLFDGETCYVVWTGGDPGATATATFTGGRIPFGDIRPSQLEGQDPIAAGDGSLIFPALKSPNYVPGESGWYLSRDGDIELNDVTARGDLRVNGSNGSYVYAYNSAGQSVIDLMPPSPSVGEIPARIATQAINVTPAYDALAITGPKMPGGRGTPSIVMISESDDGSVPPQMQIYNDPNFSSNLDVVLYGNLRLFGRIYNPNVTANVVAQNIPTGGASGTMVSLGAIRNTYGMLAGGDIVIPRKGVWDIGFLGYFAAQAASVGFRQIYIYVNGTEVIQKRENVATNYNNAPVVIEIVYPIELNIGDVVSFGAYQTSGGILQLTSSSRVWADLREAD